MNDRVSRRQFLLGGVAAGFGLGILPKTLAGHRALGAGQPAPIPMVVYSDPGCGCCANWVKLMEAAGFKTTVTHTTDMASIKQRYQISGKLASCHTALVGGYLVEGHVPADLIQKMLREKPKIAGLAVPGMVTGSPGMEGPNPQRYDVLTFDSQGKTTVYARR